MLKQFDKLSSSESWDVVEDTLEHLNAEDTHPMDAYGEYIFFHDFVQNILFGSRSNPADDHPLLLLQRNDIQNVTVTWEGYESFNKIDAEVERVNLYLLRTGIAVLTFQVATDEFENLAEVLAFNDNMRRSHLPFFRDCRQPSLSRIKSISFQMVAGEGPKFKTDDDIGSSKEVTGIADALMKQDPRARRVLPYTFWRWLLSGDDLSLMPIEPTKKQDFYWRHFNDERLPILTTVVLNNREDYYNISQGDWNRIAFIDPPGGDPFPYAEQFLTKNFDAHCYDRYHHPQSVTADAPLRYLMCDYGLTAVTYRYKERYKSESKDIQETLVQGFENSYASTIEMHMQRHYYQLYLMCVIDKSVLLSLSSRISEAVKAYDHNRLGRIERLTAEERLANEMQEIEREFLHYVHRFRFTGISGQLQPSEMYAQLRSVMKLDELYDDIKNELETAVSFLNMREERRSADAAERLNVIATIGVILGLVIAFFSMDIVTDTITLLGGDQNDAAISSTLEWKWILGGLMGVFGLGFVIMAMFVNIKTGLIFEPRVNPRITQSVMLLITVVAFFGFVWLSV